MNDAPLFTKKEFAEFVIRRFQKQTTEYEYRPLDANDPFKYGLTRKETGAYAILYLHNAWETYIRTGDMNAIVDYMNDQLKIMKFTRQMEENFKGVDLTKIYPAIRSYDFRKQQESGEMYLFDERVPRLDSLFLERQDGFSVFLTKEYIKPALVYMSEEEIKEHAYANLRRRGWNPEHYRMPAPPGVEATFHMYLRTDYPFQHQFFLPDMARNRLPASYLVAIPARDMAVVLTAEEPLTSAYAAGRCALASGFSYFVDVCFRKEPRPISRNVYWVHEGKSYCLHSVRPGRVTAQRKRA